MKFSNSELSNSLFSIALNGGYDAFTLRAAYANQALDLYDKRVLLRYIEGRQLATDHLNLQTIAIKLNEVEA